MFLPCFRDIDDHSAQTGRMTKPGVEQPGARLHHLGLGLDLRAAHDLGQLAGLIDQPFAAPAAPDR